ncbi:acyl carrier protein [Sporanaerobacter acetigenes]|uniref:Acyl carrier protein n=1 Tax=Sporanaerobacter acetigenes DSM 13106 TaxID=1123281 RepID=A0A1M5XY21_9FIRM|nr:acyl carrier protein [Sporanaerobacter acetigenes]SHI04715.1 acyl carrier protein [Sporanaerobacter acetigenes DSM 13106]
MVFEKLKKIISEQFDINANNITMDSSFQDDLNADSLDVVELIMAIEDEFDLEVEDESVEKISTVRDVVEYIQNHIGEID